MRTIVFALLALISSECLSDPQYGRDREMYDFLIWQQLQEQTRIQRQMQFEMEQRRIHEQTRRKIDLMSGAFPGNQDLDYYPDLFE